MSNCNHDLNDTNNTIVLSKKWLGVSPRTWLGYCKECKEIFKYIKENGQYKDLGN